MKKSSHLLTRLPLKLLRIREALDLSQGELIKALKLEGHKQQQISAYERGEYEPKPSVLLKYSRAVNICLDVLVDDRYDLPDELPRKKTYHPH